MRISGFEGESLEQGPSNRRLGHRFETCVSAWFQHHPEWDINAANYMVQLCKRTAGEIDLLVERAGEVLHLELAVKFYLYFWFCAVGHVGGRGSGGPPGHQIG